MVRLDDDQKRAVSALANTVVTAGAGSGKTTVLAARFIHLLRTRDVSIDRILSLTFTNKAAAEMYTRIYRELLSGNDEYPVEASAATALLDFHKAQIATIDSFCARIARADASRFGMPEDFAIADEELDNLAAQTALEFYLEQADEPAIKLLIRHQGFSGFCEAVLGRIARECLTIAENVDFKELFDRQYAFLDGLLPGCLSALGATCASLLGPEYESFKTVKDNRTALASAGRMTEQAAAGCWDEVRKYAVGLTLRKPGGKPTEAGETLKALIDDARTEAGRLDRLAVAFGEREIRMGLHDLLSQFQERWNARKRAGGLVGYADVARMAVVALRENRKLREYFKGQFRFIMIDEFQDNNHLQKELLYLLAEKNSLSLDRVPLPAEIEPDKLFFVGDEKQSIYAFRGAEVDVFKALKRELEETGGGAVSLSGNYRSRPGLVDFFNLVFQRVMGTPGRAFEAEFEPLAPARTGASGDPEITLFLKEKVSGVEPETSPDEDDDGLSSHECEAFAIASWLKEKISGRSLSVGNGNGARPAEYADCAVLLRSTGNQIIIERTFRRLGIPYETQSLRSLFMEPPVNDIYALLQSALHPDDRIAYATLLRSPFVGLSDAGLLAVLAAQQSPFVDCGLAGGDDERFARGRGQWGFIRERLDRWPVSRLVFHAWYAFGYRYHVLRDPSANVYREYFDYYYALALRAERKGLSLDQFLSWTRENLGRYEKLEEIDPEWPRPRGVRIMSIHKAKGLQFPIVIAANLGNRGRPRRTDPPVHFSDRFGPVVSLGEKSYLVELQAEDENLRELAELKRLLYVTLTRAEDHLVLSGVLTSQNRKPESSLLGMLLDALGLPAERPGTVPPGRFRFTVLDIPDYSEVEARAGRVRAGKRNLAAAAGAARGARAPVRDWRRTTFTVTAVNEWHNASRAAGTDRAGILELPALSVDRLLKTDEARARWGTLAHFTVSEKLLARYDRALVPSALRSGFEDKEFALLAAEAEALAESFLASDWGRRARAAAERETEFPFLYRHVAGNDDYLIRGDVDLYFVENRRVQVLDFKTDRVLDPRAYEAQLAIYRAALAAWTGLPVESRLYALRTGASFEIPDTIDLDALCARYAREAAEASLEQ
jgi:ATP-dependent exoDNAse (exonuclease V) beta subunit